MAFVKTWYAPAMNAGLNDKIALLAISARSAGVAGALLVAVPLGFWTSSDCIDLLESFSRMPALAFVILVGALFGLGAGLGIGTVVGLFVTLFCGRRELQGHEKLLTALLSVSLVIACFADGLLSAHERFKGNCANSFLGL